MGLLDDAIREHLDLKRRRGGDPAEIERAEREALGPVRRGPEVTDEEEGLPGSAFEPEAGHFDAEHPASEPAPEAEHWERFEEDPELEALEHHDERAPYEAAHAPGGDPLMENEPFPEPGVQPPPHPADLPEPSGSEAYPGEPAPAAPHLEQETEEYELEEEPESDDDMLETTPEFLQDAPDHDRLWFEQRPPRDFDFDG
ncbi:MAG TPA: hypothetical protein VMA77_03260 [Solirubrobacteraceae bacterium]|nr:hypothetical protein [Solirubrobacteraceae bacterium]